MEGPECCAPADGDEAPTELGDASECDKASDHYEDRSGEEQEV
jgi:hypothetical protein